MSQFTSFQALKNAYPMLSSLSVRVHGGLYGKDEPFNQTFTGDDSMPQSRFPIKLSCKNPRITNGCAGMFDVRSSIDDTLKRGKDNDVARMICHVIAPGMTQECRNMCTIEIQAAYETP